MLPPDDNAPQGPRNNSSELPPERQPHELAAIEQRIAEIDRQLESVKEGQPSGIPEWRKLLLAKERLQQNLLAEKTPVPANPISTAAPNSKNMIGQPRVLIVDDDVDTTTMLSHLFAVLGCTSGSVTDPAHAVDRMRELQPAVVTIDLAMPGMNGLELLPRLRAVDVRPRPFMAVISGYCTEKHRAQAIAAGADRFWAKPLTLDDIREIVTLAKDAAKPAS